MVQASYCPSCGAPVPAGAQFCSYCGKAIPSGSPPLASSSSFASPSYPPPSPPAPSQQAAAPARRRRTWVIVAVVLIVLLLVVGVAAVDYFEAKPPAIQVPFIVVWAPNNVCGLNSSPIEYYGFNSSTSQAQSFDLAVPNYNATPCTVTAASTNSTGFSLSHVEVPITVPGNGTGSMNITITPPARPYSGNMNLVFV